MQVGFTYSIILHIALFLLLMFGIDYSKKLSSQEETILLELIPISTITNVKTTTNDVKQIDKKKELISKDEVKKDTKTNLKNGESDNANISQKKVEPKKLEENKIEKKEVELKEEKVEEKKEPEIKKDKETKQEKKLEKKEIKEKDIPEKKKKKTQPTEDDELANSVLKSLQEGGKKSSKNNQEKQKSLNDIMENAIKGDTTTDFNAEGDLSMSEIAAIRSQISQAWRVTSFSGGKDNNNLRVIVTVKLSEQGEVEDIQIKKKSIPVGVNNQIYNAFVDSVMRAIRTASPLQNLPSDKYSSWNEMELTFDSSGMIY